MGYPYENRNDRRPKLKKLKLRKTKKQLESEFRYQKLISIASIVPGDSNDISIPIKDTDIPWLNPTLIQEGKEFVQRNWFAIFLAHFISLIIGAALRPGISVMIRTGLSHKRENALKRYLSTTLHVRTWYESATNEVIRDMHKVRRLHAKAVENFHNVPIPVEDIRLDASQKLLLEAVKEDVKVIPGQNKVLPQCINTYDLDPPISQLAMVMTQFSFMSFVVLFPKVFGIHDTKGMEGFCHLWALLGKYIGIEDEFNLGLQPDTKLMRRLFDEISVPGLKECDDVTMVFWDAITHGVQQYRPFVTMNAVLLFIIQDLIGIEKGQNIIRLMSWYDYICYQLLHFGCAHLLNWTLLRWITNWDAKRIINSAKKKYM